jgi:hypothetical protein
MPIKEFVELLKRMNDIHAKKNKDYADQANPFENFDRQAEVSSWFDHNIDKSFAGMMALKMARLATLLNKAGEPNFESIEDTFIDLANYSVLWAAWHKRYDKV